MKIAANVIAVLGWGGFLAALWAALLAERILPLGMLLAVLAASLFIGLVVPAYLLGIEGRTVATARPAVRGPHIRLAKRDDE